MRKMDDWGFYLGIGAMVVTIGVLVATDSMPEKAAAHFNALTDVSISTNYHVLQEPTPGNNVLIYAVNEVAARTVPIAENEPGVKEIIDSARASKAAVTIAAVQPTVYEFRSDGRTSHSASGVLTITVNHQTVDSRPYLQAASFNELDGKSADSYQQVWTVMVDLAKGTVTDIQETSEMQMAKTLSSNVIYAGTNMYMPGAIKIDAGTTLKWVNTSDLPHNVMGVYNTASGKKIPVDSGFMQDGGSWKYAFNEAGILEYHCSTHAENGMRGSILVLE